MPQKNEKTTAFDACTIPSGTAGPVGQQSTTVVFLTQGSPDETWMKRVSTDERDARTIFVEPDGQSFRPHVYSSGDSQQILNSDLETAATAAACHPVRFATGEITFSTPEGAQKFTLQPKGSAGETKILTQEGLESQIKARNIDVINSLVRQLRSALGVIPFVGAGMSAAIRFSDLPPSFPQWSDLLLGMADGTTKEAGVRLHVREGKYELAAQTIDELRPGVLPLRIRDAFDREVDISQLVSGALSYVPALANGPIITTNFDRVLEQVFDAAGKPLHPISGPKPDEMVSAIHQNERALLKIHGDCCDRTFRVLTVDEYNRAYGISEGRDSLHEGASIGSMARLMFTNRPLLFLGCSLESDRTTEVLRALRKDLPGLTHYAILAGHYSLSRWEERERNLDQMGVRALWFAPGQFTEIESLLRELLERSSTRKLSRVQPVISDTKTPVDGAAITQAFRDLKDVTNTKQLPPEYDGVLQTITSAMLEGKLAFFLGAYAHLKKDFLGNQFYQNLAKRLNCPALGGDRAAVASFIVSRDGSKTLWREIRAMLGEVNLRSSIVHQLLAALPGVLRATNHGNAAPLWVFTTNYDDVMERAMTAAGERFHLLYYNGGTAEKDHGRFIERRVDGTVRVIERPENLRAIDPESNVIVKFNGGLVHNADFPESVLTASGHFERFAAAIPAALPLYLRTALCEKSWLFLGHGLGEPDVDTLIRYSASEHRTIKSWAIQIEPAPEWRPAWEERREHFRSWGVQTVVCDLKNFLGALHQKWVDELCPPERQLLTASP